MVSYLDSGFLHVRTIEWLPLREQGPPKMMGSERSDEATRTCRNQRSGQQNSIGRPLE